MTHREIFESLRNEWNSLSDKTWDAIKDIFFERNTDEIELDDVTINTACSDEAFDVTMVKFIYDKKDDMFTLVGDDGEEYSPGEISRGEELWLYYAIS